jgi:hypothetical protein
MKVLCIIGRPIFEMGTTHSKYDVFIGVVYDVEREFDSGNKKFYVLKGRDEETAYDSIGFIPISISKTKKRHAYTH